MKLQSEVSEYPEIYDNPDDFEQRWDMVLNSGKTIYLSVFLAGSEIYVADASIQNYKSDSVELGLNVVKEYRNQGLGTELVQALIAETQTILNAGCIRIKTKANNTSCRRMIEKCGGILSGFERQYFTLSGLITEFLPIQPTW